MYPGCNHVEHRSKEVYRNLGLILDDSASEGLGKASCWLPQVSQQEVYHTACTQISK